MTAQLAEIRSTRRHSPRSVEEYLEWKPRDGFKYEWIHGKIQKFEKMLTPDQYHIYDNLSELFLTTPSHDDGGRLVPELKCRTVGDQMRVPDICFVTDAQRRTMAQGTPVTPLLAMEILSKTNDMLGMFSKLEEYFAAGTAMVWLILPSVEKIYIYTSPIDVQIFHGDILCSAELVVPKLTLSTRAIFKKPV